ncbi:MAG: oxygen-binding di-iron domain-containing protein [Frankiaceae bacterium]
MGHTVAGGQDGPVEIADRVWWVGHMLPDDVFQCHVYLVEHADQSVLIDPGSVLTFPSTVDKVQKVVPFDHIRYFLCSHQDPDVTAALPRIDKMVTRPDACLVTDWRSAALLKHFGTKLPFWLVDAHDWRLDLGGRVLEFLLTPYLHFAGAFVTFDPGTGTLFSSDLFGGFTNKPRLFAENADYFEAIRPFHEHYMPSREILDHTLRKLDRLDIQLIAPQHGSIIPGHLVRPIISRLRELECGLYLRVEDDTDIERLSRVNGALREALKALVLHPQLAGVVAALVDAFRPLLPVTLLDFYVLDEAGGPLHLSPRNSYRGAAGFPAPEICRLLEAGAGSAPGPVVVHDDPAGRRVLLCLRSPSEEHLYAVAVLHLAERVDVGPEIRNVLAEIAPPLAVAVQGELMYRTLDLKRVEMYQRSIRDPLTGLHNRGYLEDAAARLFAIHDRGATPGIAVAMVDIDHFKRVNDTFGHDRGDVVLREVADVLAEETRRGDIAVRLGGEEFAVFFVGLTGEAAVEAAERLRAECSRRTRQSGGQSGGRSTPATHVTVSVGVAERGPGEVLAHVLRRADSALYAAKAAGRDGVCRG